VTNLLDERRSPRAVVQPSLGPQATGPLHTLARSRWTRRGLGLVSALCALVALGAMAFPTLSNWYAGERQHQLAAQLDDPTLAGQVRTGAVGDGKPIGRITIPAIGVDDVMVQGVNAGALASGPGHYPGTPMPCTVGDAAIAGHRTTFLHPFYSLDALRPGDVITISTPAFACSYTVTAPPFAVAPTDTAIAANTPGIATLTLTTCTPRGSAAKRLVVKAVMVPTSLRPAPTSAHAPA
jgi:LPXTG-site transpeptidase (sortase) family protein